MTANVVFLNDLYGIAYFIKMISPSEGQEYLNNLDQISWLYQQVKYNIKSFNL